MTARLRSARFSGRARLALAALAALLLLAPFPGPLRAGTSPVAASDSSQGGGPQGGDAAAPEAGSSAAGQSEEREPVVHYGDRISVFSDPVHIPKGTVQEGDVVCIGSDAVIEGEVRNVVIVGGTLRLTGRVRDQVVGVLSDLDFDQASVDGQLVAVAGSLERGGSYIGGQSFDFSGGRWIGRLPSPFGVIGGLMFWGRLFKLFLAFVVLLLLASVVPERIRRIGEEAPVRYLPALLIGLVAYLAAALLLLVSILTVVGFPIALLLLRLFKWLGIAGILHAVGGRMGRSMGREMSLLGSMLLAFALFALVSLFPYLAGFAGAGWWLVLPSQSLVFFGVWIFVEAPGLGLVILTRAGAPGPLAAPPPAAAGSGAAPAPPPPPSPA